MKIISKEEMADMPKGTIFEDYFPNRSTHNWQVKDDWEFGAISICPVDGEVFDWDWSLNEYRATDRFVIAEEEEIRNWIWHLIVEIGSVPGENITDEKLIMLKNLLRGLTLPGED